MNTTNQNNHICFRDLLIELNQVKATAFTGNFIIQVSGTPSWMLSFSAGRLSALGGGIDAIGRWTRSLALASLNLPPERLVKSTNREEIFLNSNKLAQAWAVKEVLFDIIQLSQHRGDRLACQIIPTNNHSALSNLSLPLLDLQPLLQETIQAWQEWERHGLTPYSPSFYPTIQKPEQLARIDGIQDLEYLITSIDGSRSIGSLAIHHQQKIIDVGITLLPLLKLGIIYLASAPTHNLNLDLRQRAQLARRGDAADIPQAKTELPPLVACIDDSIFVYRNLEKILVTAGYRSIGIQEPLKIIPTLIKNKPDLIFLDLVMPVTNGYEVCEQIRKTPSLANIPIVILTGSDGLIDRVRTKFVGANGFIGKPATAESVLKSIDKYLDKKSLSQTAKSTSLQTLRAKKSIIASQLNRERNSAKRVLVVDDDNNIREVVAMCLQKLKGWDTLSVGSGQEGLNSIGTYQPDAIVLDLMMPHMDGLTFLHLLRSNPTTKLIPVVLMTANLYLPGRDLLTELGVVDIISKPFVPVNLVKQIDLVFAEGSISQYLRDTEYIAN